MAAVLVVLALYLTGGSTQSRFGYEGTKLDGRAPDFRLVDQNGNSVSLSDFRDRVVVLTLLDPDCTDICPIYAHQYRLAYKSLGEHASKVVFLAFNANDEKTSVDDVAAATKKWGMGEIPTWHFLTGSPETLQAVWKAYGLLASGPPKPDKPDEKQHSPAFFMIDQAGQRRWYFSTNFEAAPPASVLIVKHVMALLAEDSARR
ncbi:MAG: SCO family protein [Candidatus Omnitrophica bacterium]|nr:SCO family protein [Candidatus Omnitrophota bacterium]